MTATFEPLTRWTDREDALIVHAEARRHDHILTGGNEFFQKLGLALRDRGILPLIVPAESDLSAAQMAGPQTHVVVGPRRRQGARVFHAYPAYVTGFWYLDRQGYFWNSSLVEARFDPAAVDAEAARAFHARVSRDRIRRNASARKQAGAGAALPRARAAVFTQDIQKYRERVDYLTTDTILAVTGAAAGGPVLVKPHPLFSEGQRADLAALAARVPNLILTEASIHDIIAASDMVISQNSAVGFEAMMHRKPVLTCAATDYHHGTLVCRSKADLRAHIAGAAAHGRSFPVEAYFYWFLGLQMLEPQRPEFAERAMARLYGRDEVPPR